MTYRTGNYAAFYVSTPFEPTSNNANFTKDFCYYNLLRAWKDVPFNDSHGKTYNVRDSSSWPTLKERLRERLRYSKNIILFLSSKTQSSIALHEEIDYGINNQGLPVIVVYPDFETSDEIKRKTYIWGNLPIFRDSKHKVPVLHIPFTKEGIQKALEDKRFMINSKATPGDYYL